MYIITYIVTAVIRSVVMEAGVGVVGIDDCFVDAVREAHDETQYAC